MDYKEIPGTEISISTVCLGGWVFGARGWGRVSDKDSKAAIHQALDLGVNFIDTAPIYGWGKSEELIGSVIRERKRSDIILATKCGPKKNGRLIDIDLSPENIEKEICASLKRLKRDYIDLYQCHWPDPLTPIDETMGKLVELKASGKIRLIGVSNFNPELLKKACLYADISTVQTHYSLLERAAEEDILPFCSEQKIGFLAYGVLGGGILSGKYKHAPAFPPGDVRSFFYKFYREEGFARAQRASAALSAIAGQRPLSQVAINWVRAKGDVTGVIAGCRNADQAALNAGSAEWSISADDLECLDKADI